MQDLFSVPASVPAPPPARDKRPAVAAPLHPVRSIAWDRIIAQLPVGTPQTIYVSALWTGVVMEVASGPGIGRQSLRRDGTIEPLIDDGSTAHTIYLTADQARAIHRERGLVLVAEPGTIAARFHFAAPGHDTSRTESVLDALAAATKSDVR